MHEEVRNVQEEVFAAAEKQITEWGIEHNERGERADAFLYCVEVKPEGCDYYIPLAPSWVISEKYRIVATWRRVPGAAQLQPEVIAVSPSELEEYKKKKEATVVDSRVVDPFDPDRSWSVEALRGPEGLRRWTNYDISPRLGDVFQERIYGIRWIDTHGNRRYAAPEAADLVREEKVLTLLNARFDDWQREGYIPSKPIPEGGDETERLYRERGWTHWHHLFTPRQLLVHGNLLEIALNSSRLSQSSIASFLIGIAASSDWSSKLCRWTPQLARSGGIGASVQTFYNQALNTLFTWANRPHKGFIDVVRFHESTKNAIEGCAAAYPADARDISEQCDFWITDPPYADAVNYHELGDYFLAWYDKQLARAFPDWTPDARTELAVQGDGDDFRRSMVEVYRNLTRHMSDNGMQMVMFTHQDPGVWADLGMILWAAVRLSVLQTQGNAKGFEEEDWIKRERLAVLAGFSGCVPQVSLYSALRCISWKLASATWNNPSNPGRWGQLPAATIALPSKALCRAGQRLIASLFLGV